MEWDVNMRNLLLDPFTNYIFMKRALAACFAMSLSCAPVGVLLVLRRMSLMGDALSHSILPGVAIGYMIAGLSLPIMGVGGFIAGILVAFVATLVSRHTILKEDASFVGFYLIALATGAIIISTAGSNIDLLHILFGQILAVSPSSLLLIGTITSITLVTLAIIYRPLTLECFDATYMRAIHGRGTVYHIVFMLLVVLNMVAAFQGMGTLLALGMMMLPAIAARFWGNSLWSLLLFSIGFSMVSSIVGLLISFHFKLPSGPSIIMVSGLFYLLSMMLGKYGSLRSGSTS